MLSASCDEAVVAPGCMIDNAEFILTRRKRSWPTEILLCRNIHERTKQNHDKAHRQSASGLSFEQATFLHVGGARLSERDEQSRTEKISKQMQFCMS